MIFKIFFGSRHFQCYGGPPGAGMPYGYPQHFGPAYDMSCAEFGPNPIDPFGYDPFAQADSNAGGGEGGEGFPDAGAMASSTRGFMSRLSKLDRYVIKKHTEIYPSETNLKQILKLGMGTILILKFLRQFEANVLITYFLYSYNPNIVSNLKLYSSQ